MNSLITFLIQEKGIPETSIILLLTLPIVATIVSIWRQIIGLKSFGIYAPIVMTFALYQLAISGDGLNVLQGLKYGLTLSVIVLVIASLTHEATRRIHLHYLPKMSLILSFVSLGIFVTLVAASYLKRSGFVSIDTLPLLLLITVSEQLISIYIKKGRKIAIAQYIGTLIFSVLTYFLISWGSFQAFLLHYPYISLLTLPVDFFIGRWRGFRIQEYFRFRTLLTDSEPH